MSKSSLYLLAPAEIFTSVVILPYFINIFYSKHIYLLTNIPATQMQWAYILLFFALFFYKSSVSVAVRHIEIIEKIEGKGKFSRTLVTFLSNVIVSFFFIVKYILISVIYNF